MAVDRTGNTGGRVGYVEEGIFIQKMRIKNAAFHNLKYMDVTSTWMLLPQ